MQPFGLLASPSMGGSRVLLSHPGLPLPLLSSSTPSVGCWRSCVVRISVSSMAEKGFRVRLVTLGLGGRSVLIVADKVRGQDKVDADECSGIDEAYREDGDDGVMDFSRRFYDHGGGRDNESDEANEKREDIASFHNCSGLRFVKSAAKIIHENAVVNYWHCSAFLS